ncbi:MAG TPA: FkbM family methyltransferase [Polyangiaceae bacterium]|nr:FkbM family methyltransferase [Polyangiaceae bacterium]
MFSFKRLVADNLPSVKPELWTDFGGTLWRRFEAWVNASMDPTWEKRPLIATIAPERLMLEVAPGDVIGKPIALFGVYEFAVSHLVRQYLAPGDVFVDVGANIGYYSVVAGAAVGPSGAVYAFEPSERIRARLERNVELNEMHQIHVRSEAVSCTSGVVRFVETQDVENDGLGYIQTSEQNVGVEVRSVSLDDVPEFSVRTPTLIKVDVEGGEPDVFRGARALLERADAPSIIFESFHIVRDAAILRDHGYQVLQPALRNGSVRLTRDLQAPPYRRWEAPNFLAVKSARGQEFVAARVVS